MKKLISLLFLLLSLSSCGSLRKGHPNSEAPKTESVSQNRTEEGREEVGGQAGKYDPSEVDNNFSEDPSLNWENPALPSIIGTAKSFLGTRYRYGGTSEKGMDCSGLVCTAFATQDIILPRISADIANLGHKLAPEEIGPGDLLFFHTTSRNRITHVGLVVEREDDDILFIHASTSAGVIISRLSENYWQRNFVLAKRIL